MDTNAIGEALDGKELEPPVDQLCRLDIDRFDRALTTGEPLLVACQQEAPLFRQHAGTRAVDFVDIRDSAGWSKEGDDAAAKMAALIAAAMVEEPAPSTVQAQSSGSCLVYGRGQEAMDAARQLAVRLDVTLLLSSGAEDVLLPACMSVPVYLGRIRRASGHLGAYRLAIRRASRIAPWSRDTIRTEAAEAVIDTDLILDMSGGMPIFPSHDKRDGYRFVDPGSPGAVQRAIFELADMVGTFEKPRYVRLDSEACAYARAGLTGCTRCINYCPTGAIAPVDEHVRIDPLICAGCGSCAALCPTEAISYSAPPTSVRLAQMSALLATYLRAGGEQPVLLLHEARHGTELISALARHGDGLPARVLPLAVTELGQVGLDLMLSALALGAERVVLLGSPANMGDLIPLETNVGYGEAIVGGLGYGCERITLIAEDDPERFSSHLWSAEALDAMPSVAGFRPPDNKRGRLRQALDALHAHAPRPVETIALSDEAPIGNIRVRAEGCTLCLACVRVCPTSALIEGTSEGSLSFREDACVQCGLCRRACPEKVIELEPRARFGGAAAGLRVLKAATG